MIIIIMIMAFIVAIIDWNTGKHLQALFNGVSLGQFILFLIGAGVVLSFLSSLMPESSVETAFREGAPKHQPLTLPPTRN